MNFFQSIAEAAYCVIEEQKKSEHIFVFLNGSRHTKQLIDMTDDNKLLKNSAWILFF